MYAIVKTGGKQYRVERGQSLLVERLPVEGGTSVGLEPLLYVDGATVLDGGEGVTVQARVVGHERGPKLRVVKFKPKRGYKRRTGHRQEMTRLEVTEIALTGRAGQEQSAPVDPVREESATPTPVAATADEALAAEVPTETAEEPVAGEGAPGATPTEEESDGA